MIITIGGVIGAGKSTLARNLGLTYGCKVLHGGDMFRQLATARGLSVEELLKEAETDESIDTMVDEQLRIAMATSVFENKDLVVESRTAAFIARRNGFPAVRLYLDCLPAVAARRVMTREGNESPAKLDLEVKIHKIQQRERQHTAHLKDRYGIEIDSALERSGRFCSVYNYDVAVMTTLMSPEEVLSAVDSHICHYMENAPQAVVE